MKIRNYTFGKSLSANKAFGVLTAMAEKADELADWSNKEWNSRCDYAEISSNGDKIRAFAKEVQRAGRTIRISMGQTHEEAPGTTDVLVVHSQNGRGLFIAPLFIWRAEFSRHTTYRFSQNCQCTYGEDNNGFYWSQDLIPGKYCCLAKSVSLTVTNAFRGGKERQWAIREFKKSVVFQNRWAMDGAKRGNPIRLAEKLGQVSKSQWKRAFGQWRKFKK